MKKIFFVAATMLAVVSFGAFTILQKEAIRSLEKYGIPADVAKQSIFYSFSGGYFSYPNVSKLKQIATGQRGEVVQEIVGFTKAYVSSADFNKRYAEYRESNKPQPPEPPKPMAQQRKEHRESMVQSLKEFEATMKSMPADQRSMLSGTVDMMKQQIKELDNPDNPMFSKQMEDVMKQSHVYALEEYKQRTAEWEEKYPKGPSPMIRKWLNQFLEMSNDIDFAAKLVPAEGGKMAFANPTYEKKSSQWKMCYRAGKEAVQAGRAAAQQWLGELK